MSARLASDRHSPTKYNEKKTFFGVLDVALHPFSVVRALFHTSYIWDTEISDMQFVPGSRLPRKLKRQSDQRRSKFSGSRTAKESQAERAWVWGSGSGARTRKNELMGV